MDFDNKLLAGRDVALSVERLPGEPTMLAGLGSIPGRDTIFPESKFVRTLAGQPDVS